MHKFSTWYSKLPSKGRTFVGVGFCQWLQKDDLFAPPHRKPEPFQYPAAEHKGIMSSIDNS